MDTVDTTKEALLHSLHAQRTHIVGSPEGLDAATLRRSTLPTGWSCIGLVHHLAVDVERFWFRQIVAGEQVEDHGNQTSAWTVDPATSPQEILALSHHEIERAEAVIGATPIEDAPQHWPDHFGSWRLADLRAIILHVITETACHAGHLDDARELIDGNTWLILD